MIKLLEEYYRHLQSRNYSEETIYGHRLQLKGFASFMLSSGVADLKAVTKKDIGKFWTFLFERVNGKGKTNQPQSRNNAMQKVSVFYQWMHAEGYIQVNPCKDFQYAIEPKDLPALSPTRTEMRRLLHAVQPDTLLGYRDRCILETFYGSAIRNGELRRLKIADLDFDACTFRVVRGKGGKSRTVPMTKVCANWLKRYLKDVRPKLVEGRKDDEGYVFVSGKQAKIGRSLPDLIVKRAAKLAGLTKRIYPHALRAACLTHMLRNSDNAKQDVLRPLMELAGHADLTTLHRYTATDITVLKEIHAKTHPREIELG